MNAAAPLQDLMQAALDAWLTDNPELRAGCAALAGRTVALELTDIGAGFCLAPDADGIRVRLEPTDAPDARIRARGSDLLRALGGRAGAALEVSGDAETAQALRALLRAGRFDPEERLAALLGDLPAHQLGRAFRGVAALGRGSAAALGGMAAEYLKFEARVLPTRAEVDGFVAEVDRLRDDVERAVARVTAIRP